jgi:prophage antirepressor-like protein
VKALQVFDYRGNKVRTTVIDGQPWFCAADICQALEISNPRDAVGRLDEDEKGVALTDTPGGAQEMIHVSESGLYSLILTSRKPEARNFKRWITHEVLPQIRKTGAYLPQSPTEALLKAVTILHEQEKRLQQLEAGQEHIRETIAYQPDNWRSDMNRLFNKIVERHGREKFAALRRETYKRLEERARVDLDRRLQNLKARLALEGATKTAIERANRLDVIEADPKLREIYAIILKELAIREAV